MSLITIDEQKCKRDGICVAECPMHIIAQPDKDAPPQTVEGADELCINCGHCMAVCPHGALSLRGADPDTLAPVLRDAMPDPVHMDNFLRARRSVRQFKDKPVPREVIEECLEAARYAPSGHNFEPVHWTVVHDIDEVKRCTGLVADYIRMLVDSGVPMAKTMHLDLVIEAWDKGVDKIVRGARHVVVAHAARDDMTAQAACTIALAHFELAAQVRGVGATWGGFFHAAAAMYPPLAQALGLPDGHQSYGAMLLGYNKFKYHRVPPRKPLRVDWK